MASLILSPASTKSGAEICGGIMTYAAAAPVSALVRAEASFASAANASTLEPSLSAILDASRATARTFSPFARSASTAAFPVFPVAPKITYMRHLPEDLLDQCTLLCSSTAQGHSLAIVWLKHRNFHMVLLSERCRFGISGIHMPRNAHSRIVRQHALDTYRHFFCPIRHGNLSRVLRIADPHSPP